MSVVRLALIPVIVWLYSYSARNPMCIYMLY